MLNVFPARLREQISPARRRPHRRPPLHQPGAGRRGLRWPAMLALLAVVAAAALPLRAHAQPPLATFQAAECFVPVPDGYATECGYVIAPESHTAFDGDVVSLATVIVRSPNPNAAPDPLVFLTGGPGQAATPFAAVLGVLFERILQHRDVIYFDQRGTGYSQPSLYCPPLASDSLLGTSQVAQSPEMLQQELDSYIACGQAYQQAGVDLTTYNTPENAADIEDLRRALGYEQLNLFSASYGTRLALEAMRFRPETIRSAVLDSLVPPPFNFQVEAPASFDRALASLFAACDADAACGAAYPNGLAKWDELVARLNAAPVQLPIVNLQTGEVIDYQPVNGWDVTVTVWRLSYFTEVLPVLPNTVKEAYAGDYGSLSLLFSLLFGLFPEGEGPALPPIATSAQVAVQCYDDMPFVTADDFTRVRSQHPRGQPVSSLAFHSERYKEICSALGLGTDTPAFVNQPVSSDVPTLLIAGELDPITPAQQAYDTAATLSRSMVVVYPRGGHTPSATSPCLANAVAAYIENPAATPDTSCIAAEAPLPFVTPETARATLAQLSTERSWEQRLR